MKRQVPKPPACIPMVAETIAGAPGSAVPHDSSRLHVTGRATYTDDIAEPRDLLHIAVGMSERPHARISSMDFSAVHAAQGVVDVIVADDIAGKNNCGPVVE